LVLLVVAVRAVVEHHRQERQSMMGGRVETAHHVQQVPVGLEIHTELSRVAMGEGDAECGGQPITQTGAATAAIRPPGLPIPEPWRPPLARAVGENPVLVLDDLPYFGG